MDRANLERKLRGLRALLAPGSGAAPGERAAAARLMGELEQRLAATPTPREVPIGNYDLGLAFSWSSSGTDDLVVVNITSPTY